MKNIENIKSVLKLEELYFDEISFRKDESNDDSKIEFSKNVLSIPDGDSFKVSLKINIKTAQYRLMMDLIGVFQISGGLNDDNRYFEKNAIAIMFPYLRSQLTLITAQPGIKPAILPPININELLKHSASD